LQEVQPPVLCPVVPVVVVDEPLLDPTPPVEPATDPPLVPEVLPWFVVPELQPTQRSPIPATSGATLMVCPLLEVTAL
jgi:hypothetical protein